MGTIFFVHPGRFNSRVHSLGVRVGTESLFDNKATKVFSPDFCSVRVIEEGMVAGAAVDRSK
jgi:hypothetical protein